MTAVAYPNTSENVTYTYDHAASNGLGRLRSISDQSGTTTYSYDEFGNIASDQRVISSVTYTTSYQYDDANNVSSITYPSGRVVDYTRDAAGQIRKLAFDGGLLTDNQYKKGYVYFSLQPEDDFRLDGNRVEHGRNGIVRRFEISGSLLVFNLTVDEKLRPFYVGTAK